MPGRIKYCAVSNRVCLERGWLYQHPRKQNKVILILSQGYDFVCEKAIITTLDFLVNFHPSTSALIVVSHIPYRSKSLIPRTMITEWLVFQLRLKVIILCMKYTGKQSIVIWYRHKDGLQVFLNIVRTMLLLLGTQMFSFFLF